MFSLKMLYAALVAIPLALASAIALARFRASFTRVASGRVLDGIAVVLSAVSLMEIGSGMAMSHVSVPVAFFDFGAFLGLVAPMYLAARYAFSKVSQDQIDTARLLGMKPWEITMRVLIPACPAALALGTAVALVRLVEFGLFVR